MVQEASEVRMELAAMGLELLEKMARSPHVVSHLPTVRAKDEQDGQLCSIQTIVVSL